MGQEPRDTTEKHDFCAQGLAWTKWPNEKRSSAGNLGQTEIDQLVI